MRQMILLVLLLASGLWGIPQATAEEQSRLWYTSALNDGGALKASMLERKVATEESVSLGALVMDAWSIAIRRGVKVEVPAERQTAFSMQLFELFLQRHDLSGTPDTTLTWQQFGEVGRIHSGFEPFTQTDAEEALEKTHELTHEQSQPQLADTATTQPLPPAPTSSAPTVVESAPVTTSQPVSPPTTSRRLVPVTTVNTGELVDAINVGRKPLPNQSQMEDFLQERAQAERKATEVAEQEPEVKEPETTETVTQGGSQEQADTTEETRPWWIPQYQWDMEQQRRERPRHRRHPAHASHGESFLRDYFSDIPEMVEVARCESTFENRQSNLRYRDGRRERSFGFFQIHEPAWHGTAMELGLDDYQTDPMQNVLLARHLYELEGLHPWRMSKGCWGPKIRRLR